jgi:hypothetical protein
MPFKSKAQQGMMFHLQSIGKLKPGTAQEWASKTDFNHLPLHKRAHIEELKKKGKKK